MEDVDGSLGTIKLVKNEEAEDGVPATAVVAVTSAAASDDGNVPNNEDDEDEDKEGTEPSFLSVYQ
jgi:hypothetical protein